MTWYEVQLTHGHVAHMQADTSPPGSLSALARWLDDAGVWVTDVAHVVAVVRLDAPPNTVPRSTLSELDTTLAVEPGDFIGT